MLEISGHFFDALISAAVTVSEIEFTGNCPLGSGSIF
jgi:hypothetical protein